MKILLFSDSHGDTCTMCGVIQKEMPDMIIHLGDSIADADYLSGKYPNIQMVKLPGNIDSEADAKDMIKITEICGKRFIMTHGHTLIKYTFISESNSYQLTDEDRTTGRINMLKCMAENNADILLHGHTHEPYINSVQTPDKTRWIMNPGIIRRMDAAISKPTYGILKIDESGALEWRFVEQTSTTKH